MKQKKSAVRSSRLHLCVLQQFQSHIHQWCKTTDKILLAVSGGLDSMVMLHLFKEAGFSISLAHCNFQLRGKESNDDESFVKAISEKWSIPFHSIRFETNNYAIKNGLSIQLAARELRYRWVKEIKDSNHLNWIATAHHLNDSIETWLLNFSKGTGLDGLLGIPEKNNHIIRPLLFATREEIENYAADNGISWREDESNQTDYYQRNFIRHQVIPKLKELNPAFENSAEKTIGKLKGSAIIVSESVDRWKNLFQKSEPEKILLKKIGFENQTKRHNTSLLSELIKNYGFHYNQCTMIISALEGQSGKRFLSETHVLIIDRDHLIITPHQQALTEVKIESMDQSIVLGKQYLLFEKRPQADQADLLTSSKNQVFLDAALVGFPIIWRKWKPGDFFYPLGMTNRKKISDFLIDEKVSLADKDSVTVLEAKAEIIWLVGHRIDNRFKVTESTRQVLYFQLLPEG